MMPSNHKTGKALSYKELAEEILSWPEEQQNDPVTIADVGEQNFFILEKTYFSDEYLGENMDANLPLLAVNLPNPAQWTKDFIEAANARPRRIQSVPTFRE
jgi:hypothetical protein